MKPPEIYVSSRWGRARRISLQTLVYASFPPIGNAREGFVLEDMNDWINGNLDSLKVTGSGSLQPDNAVAQSDPSKIHPSIRVFLADERQFID